MFFLYILLASSLLQNSYTASIEEYKSYKDYRFYKVVGDEEVVRSFIQKTIQLNVSNI